MTAYLSSVRRSVIRTPGVIRGAMSRRDFLGVFTAVTLVYLLVFLWAIGDVFIQSGVGFSIEFVPEPLSRMFEPGPGTFTYEGIAIISAGEVLVLLSPVNVAIGLGISLLVGLNIGLAYLAITQPKSCGLEASTGLFASIPALLAGSACCAPAIFLALGITATGTLLTVFSLLVPIGVILLVGSLIYLAGKISPSVV